MIIKKKKILLILFLLIVFIFSTCLTIISFDSKFRTAEAQTIELESPLINDTYAVNNKIVFPLTLDVDYGGKTYTTEKGIVYSPYGGLIDVNVAGVLLNETGKYQIKYLFKTDDGKFVSAIKDFTVTGDLYNFSVENGSSFTIGEQSDEVTVNNASDNLFSREEGLIVRLNNGSSFMYNKPIDLSNCGDEGTAEILKFDARLADVSYNNEKKKYEVTELIAEELNITLTDCYNSMNSIEIIATAMDSSIWFRVKTIVSSHSYGLSYVFPTTSNGRSSDKVVYIDDLRGLAHCDDYGTYFTGYGLNSSRDMLPGYSLTYDYKLNRVYYEYGDTRYLICDLMNTTLFDDDDFTPFATGEVYLSMTASGYKNANAVRVDVLSIGGEKVTENIKLLDTLAPKLDINIDCTENNVVNIAKGETFIIPEAKVFDVNYKGDLDVNVYRNYGNKMQSIVCSNRKSFVASVDDVYSIVYTARDSFGNVATEIINVVVVDSQKSLSLITDKLDVVYLGEENVLPVYSVVSVNDNSKVSVSITAQNGDEKINIDSYNRIFNPTRTGAYKIIYEFSDNIFAEEYSYEVEVEARKEVVFLDNVNFYDYVVKNAEYRILPISALVKTGSEYNTVEADCYVSFDNKDFNKVDNINKLKIEADNSVDIKFVCQGVSSNVYNSQVVDVGFGSADSYKLSNYFVGDFDVLEYDASGKKINNIAYQSNVKSGSNHLKFINPIDCSQFNLEYRTPLDKSKYERLNITLSDMNDKDKTFTISVRRGGDAAFISVNGGIEYLSPKKFAGDFVNSITYNGDLNVLNVNGMKFVVDLDFSGTFAYMDIELEKISGESVFTIVKLNNAIFDNAVKKESSQPIVNIDKAYGEYEINSIVNIKTPIFSDVFTPINYDTVKFTVIMPDQSYATTVDGVKLDGSQKWADSYDVELTQYGLYTVAYHGQDYLNNKGSGQYRFEAKDKNAPQIIIKDDYSKTNPMKVKVGEVKIKYDVIDNINAKEDLKVIVNLMNNRTMSIQRDVGTAFNVSEKGEYTVFMYVVDKDGNKDSVAFKLIVE